MVVRSNRRTTQWGLFFQYFTILYAIMSGVVLVPLYLKFLTVELYGAWLAASNIIVWMSIVDPGLSGVIMQKTSMAYGRADKRALNGLLTNGLVLSLLLAMLVLGAGAVIAPYLMTMLNLDATLDFAEIPPAFLVAVLGSALMIFSYGITAFNMGLQSSLGVGLIFLMTQLGSLVLTVWLLYAGFGLMALAVAMVFRGAGMLLGNLVYLLWRATTDGLHLRPSFAGFQEITRLMSFTFLGKGVGTIALNMDALIVTRYLGPEMAAVYTLTRKVPELSRSFLERPANAFMPAIGALWGSGDVVKSRSVLLRLLRIMLWCMGLAGVGFWLLNGAFVNLWVGAALYAGDSVNSLIIAGMIILVFSTSLSNLCYTLGNIKGNSIVTLIQGLISIPLMIAGAHYLGLVGVVAASFIATLLVSMTYYPRIFIRLLQIDKGDIRLYLGEIKYVIAATMVTAAVFFQWSKPDEWSHFSLIAFGMTACYSLILWALSSSLREELKSLMRRFISK